MRSTLNQKSPPKARTLSSVCDRHQAASLPVCLSPHYLLRRLCHFLALDERWAKDACRELGLSNLLSQRNHFRHFLEELVSRKATLVFGLLHTHPTSYVSNGTAKGLQMQPRRAAHFGRKRGISLPSAQQPKPALSYVDGGNAGEESHSLM